MSTITDNQGESHSIDVKNEKDSPLVPIQQAASLLDASTINEIYIPTEETVSTLSQQNNHLSEETIKRLREAEEEARQRRLAEIPVNEKLEAIKALSKNEINNLINDTRNEQKEVIAQFQKQQAIINGEHEFIDVLNAVIDEFYSKYVQIGPDFPIDGHLTVNSNGMAIDVNIITSFDVIEGNRYKPIFEVTATSPKWKEIQVYKIPYDVNIVVNTPNSDIAKAVRDFLNTNDVKGVINTNRPLFEKYNAATDALSAYRASHQKGFEGIDFPRYIIVKGNIAYKEHKTKEGKLDYKRIGSPCAIIACHKLIGDKGVEKVSHLIRFMTSTGDIEERLVPENSLLSTGGLTAILKIGDTPLRIENTSDFITMIKDQYEIIESSLPIITEMNEMGWANDDDITLLYGSHNFGQTLRCADAEICEIYRTEGILDGWMMGMKGLINIPEVRIAMALGPASMILSKVGVQSIIVHIWGKTSQIKTIRVKATMSEFCNPNKAMMTFDHSKQAPNNTFKRRNDTVILFDEIKTEKDTEEAELITKNASSGMTRQVFNFETGRSEFKEFSNIIVFTSEKKMFNVATYGGTRARCIELKAGNIPYLPNEVKEFEKHISAKARRDNYKKNYGHLLKYIYKVINRYGTEGLRVRFESLKVQFEASSAVENRIADMQAAIALGNEILNEVFRELKAEYPFIKIMDSVELVKNLTADYVEEASKPEWVEVLKLVLNNLDYDRAYLNEPEPQGNQGIVHARPIKGYVHNSKNEGKWLLVNTSSLKAFLNRKDINVQYETFMSQLRNDAKILKITPSRGGYDITNPVKTSLEGSTVVAIMYNKLREHPYFAPDHEISEQERRALVEKQEELQRQELLLRFHKNCGGLYLLYHFENDEYHLSHQEEFRAWLVEQGKSPEEADTINDRYVELYNIHKEHFEFYCKDTGHKLRAWTPQKEVHDIEGYWDEHHP